MAQEELSLERRKLDETREFIDSEIERLGEVIVTSRQLAKTEGADFNMYNPNGGMYSGLELTNVHYEIEKQFAEAKIAELDIEFLRKNRPAPYFARVDFTPDSTGSKQSHYIGLRTLRMPNSPKIVICDWRAPISSLFYDDFDSKAYFDAPNGKITGELSLKRQFKYKDGELEGYSDSSMKIDDSILCDVLSSSTSQHLKVIVNSIQREQNKAIRYSKLKNLLVCGPAGSGKTSVGFHRLAFLLYRSRRELTSSEIVMFSNNDIFSSYVADVIPELGEMPINYASFYSVFSAEIPNFRIDDYYSLAEKLINGDSLRARGARIKNSEAFSRFIVDSALSCEPIFSDIKYDDSVILTADELKARYDGDFENNSRLKAERICSYAISKIDEFFIANHEAIYEKLDADSDVYEDTAKLVKRAKHELKSRVRDELRAVTITDPVALYVRAVKEYIDKYGDGEALMRSLESTKRGVLQFEDALCVVFIKHALGSAAILSGVKHVLVDEAQDLSLLQHRILLKMFPQALFTLLADKNQAILPSVNTTDIEALQTLYGAEYMYLGKSYRSTKQINEFAMSLLPESARYDIFERNGEAVSFVSGDNGLKDEFLRLKDISPSTCIVTKTDSEAVRLYNLLKPFVHELRLCNSKSGELSNAPTVMMLSLTKGLEFDNVIVSDINGEFDGEKNKGFMYMASTRALHRLSIAR